MSYDDYYKPSRPKVAKDGIKARSQRGAFAKSWWAQRWIMALERLMDSGRLTRGRSYARKGQVLSIEEVKGGVEARVQGSRPKPYKISIQISHLTDMQWEKVIDMLAEQAIYSAQLLAGEMPQDIEGVFEAAGVSLFPSRGGDLTTDCSCPDYANPCKHIAAAYYILGERFDEDPFLIFRLRGRTQEQVMQALRLRRAGEEEVAEEEPQELEIVLPIENSLENFWDFGAPLDRFSILIRSPAIEMALLKRLGEAAFVPEPGIESLLLGAYWSIGLTAVQTAFQEDEEPSSAEEFDRVPPMQSPDAAKKGRRTLKK
jgi:uncharacterized Zn finger protein